MIILYSSDCSNCKILKKRLDNKKIIYEIINSKDIFEGKGFKSLPMLEVDNKIMIYGQAMEWVNKYKKEVDTTNGE